MAIRYDVFILTVVLISLIPRLSVTVEIPNDDISIIRQRVLELMIWPSKENIWITIQKAIVYNQTLNSSCYWSDINYSCLVNGRTYDTNRYNVRRYNNKWYKNNFKYSLCIECMTNQRLTTSLLVK